MAGASAGTRAHGACKHERTRAPGHGAARAFELAQHDIATRVDLLCAQPLQTHERRVSNSALHRGVRAAGGHRAQEGLPAVDGPSAAPPPFASWRFGALAGTTERASRTARDKGPAMFCKQQTRQAKENQPKATLAITAQQAGSTAACSSRAHRQLRARCRMRTGCRLWQAAARAAAPSQLQARRQRQPAPPPPQARPSPGCGCGCGCGCG